MKPQNCPACGERHALGEEADSTWQQWQCAACGSWNDWSARALEARGEPARAAALRRAESYKSDDILELYGAGILDDDQTADELQERGYTERRALVMVAEYGNDA